MVGANLPSPVARTGAVVSVAGRDDGCELTVQLISLQSDLLKLLDLQSPHSLVQNALESSHGASRTDGLILAAQEKKVEPGKK